MCKRITIDVSDSDRQALTAIVMDRNSPQKHVWRAQIVLLTADGCGTMELSRRTGTSKTSVWRWHYKRHGTTTLFAALRAVSVRFGSRTPL